MATCVDVAGARDPEQLNGKPIQPMEGRSLVTAFGNQLIQRRSLHWEHQGNAAIRVGDWKLVRRDRAGAWELFDLKKDRTELNDLTSEQPDQDRILAAQRDARAERARVKPYPNNYELNEGGGKKKKGKGKKKA
jgi:arylsulfatase